MVDISPQMFFPTLLDYYVVNLEAIIDANGFAKLISNVTARSRRRNFMIERDRRLWLKELRSLVAS